MLKISFHGLCGFARRNGEVRVLMPDARSHKPAHRAVMLIELDFVVPAPDKTTWMPNAIVSVHGGQLGLWELSEVDKFSVGTGEPPVPPDSLINLAALHKGHQATPSSGALMSLKGGSLHELNEYPAALKVHSLKAQVASKKYAEVVEWRSDDLVDITTGSRRIVLRKGKDGRKDEVLVAISNTAPSFSPNHEGLAHFHGYYATLGQVPHDEHFELSADKSPAGVLTAGGGNCVPNAELP